MSTPRIPPVPPNKGGDLDKTAPTTSHRKVEKVDKIEKVAEVDDESRARQFRQFVDAEEETPSSLPTPFALFSINNEEAPSPISLASSGKSLTSSDDSGMEQAAEESIPSPSYSPPPATVLGATAASEEEAETPLPRSNQFWSSVDDNPDSDQPPMQPKMEETPRSSQRIFMQSEKAPDEKKTDPREKGRDAVAERGKMGQGAEGSLFGPPGKPALNAKDEKGRTDKKGGSIFSEEPRRTTPGGIITPKGKEGGAQYVGPLARESDRIPTPPKKEKNQISHYAGPLPAEEKGFTQAARPLTPEEEEQKPFSSLSLSRSEEMREERKTTSKMEAARKPLYEKEAPPFTEKEKQEEKGKKKQTKEEVPLQLESPTIVQLPDAVIPAAATAASQASPYLGPEALSIYFHMIGTIVAMVSPRGDSRTEFVLNAPSFANSKFYGSTISIERFATAPYQLNIRLTGSNEAVQQFNQNIPNLLAAFERGKFSFTINRIEAVYEKPLFKRKEGAGEKGDRGFDSGTESRKR